MKLSIEGRLQIFTESRGHKNLVKDTVATLRQTFLPLMAYIRDGLPPGQLQLGSRLKDKCLVWNLEAG